MLFYVFCENCSHIFPLFIITRVNWIWSIQVVLLIFTVLHHLCLDILVVYTTVFSCFAVVVKNKTTVSNFWDYFKFQINFSVHESLASLKTTKSTFYLVSCRSQHVVENDLFILCTCLVFFHTKWC